MQNENTLQENCLPPLNIYFQDVTVKAWTRSRREMSCILNLFTLQLFVFSQSPTTNVSPFFFSLCYDRPQLDKTCTICRNSSSVNEEVHNDLLQDVFALSWCWWKRLSTSAHTDSHCLLLLQQPCQQRAVFRVENGLDYDFFSPNNALESRFDSATQTTSSQQVCCANRKDDIWNREQSHHKHCSAAGRLTPGI